MSQSFRSLTDHGFFVPSLIQIGESIQVIKGSSTFVIDELYANPTGMLVFKVSGNESSLLRFVEELRFWTNKDIDDIALEYFYKKTGQAMLVIDEMCREGLLTYKDSSYLARGMKKCLSNQSFILMINESSVTTGEELLSCS